MKTLSQITKEVYKEYGYDSWFEACQDFKSVKGVLVSKMFDNRLMKEVARRFAREVAREALKNAIIKQDEVLEQFAYRTHGTFAESLRESILNENNIPEL